MKSFTLPSKDLDDLTEGDFGGVRSEKTVCVVRYGGFGDMIQTASILPLLKKQGYRVCVNVTENGSNIIRSDPYVDELLIQETDQIPVNRLTEYWEKLSKCFDKVVQLSESVEGSLLVISERVLEIGGEKTLVPCDPRYNYSKEKLHKECNINYMERTHDLAGVPYEFSPRFYPTQREIMWAKKFRKKIKTKNIVLWALAGSSVHKVYPWVDAVIASILKEREDVSFVTVGDNLCSLLEMGWENEKRVVKKSGKWSIRKTLAFIEQCDLIVGPETGVLNAASSLPMRKIVMLSHSSEENLSKHWVNTLSLEPDDCECFPCHKLHPQGFITCTKDETTGGALCASLINPETITNDILRNLK